MQHKVIWLGLSPFKNMLIADKNIKNDNKHLHCCSVVLCVNSCKVDKTAAHRGGEEGRILTVPIHCFVWAV